MPDIREEAWFFQEMAPLLATAVLGPMPEGSFLVRSFKRRLALSFVSDSTVKHLWIHRDDDGQCYVLRHEKFASVRQMIDRYRACRSLGQLLAGHPGSADVEAFLRLPVDDIELGSECTDGTESQLTTFHQGRYGSEAVTAVTRRHNSSDITACLRNEAFILIQMGAWTMQTCSALGLYLPSQSRYTLVVEHVNCGNLRQFLLRQGDRLLHDWEILVSLAHQAAAGLAYLHRKGVLHCDLV
uniref:Tyrosine-protein kinase n=1 Tax=Macrostomum lignano TaxID=282301 RepID=A0A1I8JQY8_9PLAT